MNLYMYVYVYEYANIFEIVMTFLTVWFHVHAVVCTVRMLNVLYCYM